MEAKSPRERLISIDCSPLFAWYETIPSSPDRPKPRPKAHPDRKCGQADTEFPSQVACDEDGYQERGDGDAASVSVDAFTHFFESNKINLLVDIHPRVDQLELSYSLEDSKELTEEGAISVQNVFEGITKPEKAPIQVVDKGDGVFRRPYFPPLQQSRVSSHIEHICTLCGPRPSFKSASDIKRHIKNVHTQTQKGGKKWVCQVPTCPMASKIWTRQDIFRRHIIRWHRAQYGYLAEEMEKQFDSDISVVPLGHSGTGFVRESLLNQHMAYEGDYEDQSQWKTTEATSAAASFLECLNSISSSVAYCDLCESGTCVKCTKSGSVTSQPNADREDFIECATRLLAAFTNAEHEVSAFSCAISCVLNSARALHKMELQEAVRIHKLKHLSHFQASKTFQEVPKWGYDTELSGTIDEMLASAESIFTEDDAGFVHFKHETMGTFLHNFRIDGVDASHKTLAIICLAAFQNQPDNDINHSWNYGKKLALASYAREYCHYHCKAAASSSLALGVGVIQPKTQGCTVEDQFELLPHQMEGLNVVDECEDWLLL